VRGDFASGGRTFAIVDSEWEVNAMVGAATAGNSTYTGLEKGRRG